MIRVSRRTLGYWAAQHPEFGDAMDIAKAIAAHWWEKRARDGDGGPGAASMCQFALKNLAEADFTDRREVSYSGAVQHNLLTYDQAVEEARRRGLQRQFRTGGRPDTLEPNLQRPRRAEVPSVSRSQNS